MAINFPNSPSDGQQLTEGSVTYTYNATKGYWESTESSSSSSSSTTVVANMSALIALTGMSDGDQALVQATNKLYMYSGTGWYLIATIQNNAPSAITGVSGTYELAIDGTATTITAASTDPEGFPLTWSYSTSGLGSIATVSNTDNVFTITPSTTIADAGTFSLTINATDGINGAVSTSTNLTLEFIIIVTNSRYTTLLATATNTSDNNNITDTSTNNHTITVNGDAYAGTFSPYRSGGYSTYFDGAGDYIDTGLNNAATDFTFECWVNTTVGGMLMARYASGSALDGFIINTTDGYPVIQINTNANNLNGTVDLRDGKWHHLAFVRDSNVCKIFVDGVLDVSQTDSEPMQVNANWIIGRHGNNASYYYGGYIRDLRWIAGTARYTGNFTPPTEPLTTLSGDNLFTCHLPYISDGSTNDHTITVNGNVSTKPFTPYDYNEYSATDHGGSVYFVGGANYSSQYLSLSGPTMPSGDFTLSTWAYLTSNGSDTTLIDFNGNSGGFRIMHTSNSNGGYHFRFYTAGATVYLYDQNIDHHLNQWNYIVVVRDSGTFKLYVNNKLINTSTATPTFSSSTNVRIGQALGGFGTVEGYLSDIIYNPTTAITDFTPPTAPLSSSGTSLHIKGTDASIIDKSQSSNLKLIGTTTGSTTQAKFVGSKSMYFDGTGDKVSWYPSLPFDDDDFTIEFWWRPEDTGKQAIFFGTAGTDHSIAISYSMPSTGQTMNLWASSNGTSWNLINADGGGNGIGSETVTQNAWNHIAVTRQGTAFKLFTNGVLDISVTASGAIADYGGGTYPAQIGQWWQAGTNITDLHGYIQDFRITNGLARYTTNFTPPTASLEG